MGIMMTNNGTWAPKALKIRFPDDDPQYAGLWIRMRRITIGEVLERNELQAELAADEPRHPGDDASIDDLRAYALALGDYNAATMRRLAQDLADHTVAWNVHRVMYSEDGETETLVRVKPDLAGYLAQPEGFLHAVSRAWRKEIVSVSAPLPESSSAGEPSPTEDASVLSLPMEPTTPDRSS